jgi:catechol 2,3-dioxygenase-like lactoylglutathione lyase family enzyme
MTRSIRPLHVNHMNAVLEDFDASVAHLNRTYGAEFLVDLAQKEFHAYLFEMGQVIFEAFVPWDFLVISRYGPHYLGIEWQADIDEVRAALADHGVRTVRDIGIALHTHPADCFGVSYEFFAGYFHDPDFKLLAGKIKPREYWQGEHALGLTGLKGYTHVVEDIAAASAFLQSFLSAEPLFEEDRPAIAGRARGFKVADIVVELLTPTGPGWLLQQLRRQGEGILSTVFGVGDIAKARRYFTAKGVPLEAGTAEANIAVPAEANLGIMFEFAE